MHEYMTRHMVALIAMTYAQQELNPGDPFRATPIDGDYLARNRRAKDASHVEPHVAAPVNAARAEVAPAAPVPVALVVDSVVDPAPHAEPELPAPRPSPDEAESPIAPPAQQASSAPPADPVPRKRGRPPNATRLAPHSANGDSPDLGGA